MTDAHMALVALEKIRAESLVRDAVSICRLEGWDDEEAVAMVVRAYETAEYTLPYPAWQQLRDMVRRDIRSLALEAVIANG